MTLNYSRKTLINYYAKANHWNLTLGLLSCGPTYLKTFHLQCKNYFNSLETLKRERLIPSWSFTYFLIDYRLHKSLGFFTIVSINSITYESSKSLRIRRWFYDFENNWFFLYKFNVFYTVYWETQTMDAISAVLWI